MAMNRRRCQKFLKYVQGLQMFYLQKGTRLDRARNFRMRCALFVRRERCGHSSSSSVVDVGYAAQITRFIWSAWRPTQMSPVCPTLHTSMKMVPHVHSSAVIIILGCLSCLRVMCVLINLG